MQNTSASQRRTPAPATGRLPTYISATELRPRLLSILAQLVATRGTIILCRYNKPAAILRGGLDDNGELMIHLIPVQSEEGQRVLKAARRSA